MKYLIFIFVGLFSTGCKTQQLSFTSGAIQKSYPGIEEGETSISFNLTTSSKKKDIGTFTKAWYNSICYEISKVSYKTENDNLVVTLHSQEPPSEFRSSKSPIPLTEETKLVLEHKTIKETIEYIGIKNIKALRPISFPSAPPE